MNEKWMRRCFAIAPGIPPERVVNGLARDPLDDFARRVRVNPA